MANVLKSNVGLGLDAFLEFAGGVFYSLFVGNLMFKGIKEATSGRECGCERDRA